MILVYGDVMLDSWVMGKARVGQEGGPVFSPMAGRQAPGGAGNVAMNVVSLSPPSPTGAVACRLVGVVGADEPGRTLRDGFRSTPKIDAKLIERPERLSTLKQRVTVDGQMLVRLDIERIEPLSAAAEQEVMACFEQDGVDAVVISDYGKGGVTPDVAAALIARAAARDIPTIVDTKTLLHECWAGATILKPNIIEICSALGRVINNDFDAGQAALALLGKTKVRSVVLTLGEHGMAIAVPGAYGTAILVPPIPVEEVDVTGAGDTVAAALAVKMAARCGIGEAAQFANAAAAWSVTQSGTAAVPAEEAQAIADRYAGNARSPGGGVAEGRPEHRLQ